LNYLLCVPEACPACHSRAKPLHVRTVHNSYSLRRCPDCRSEYLAPQPDDARLAEIYAPDYYEAWHWEQPDVLQAMKGRTFMRALRLLEPRPGSLILDVGCAQGELAKAALSLGMNVTGLDLNPEAIETAKKRVPGARFICGELDPDVVGGGWDIVTMFDFIEHVRSPTEVLAAAARVLAPSGRLLISTPRIGSGFHRLTRRAWPQYREEHLVLFSAQGMQSALAEAGLRIIRIVPTTKFVSLAYLLGQASEYGPPLIRLLARGSKGVSARRKLVHRVIPVRFGEMTIVAER